MTAAKGPAFNGAGASGTGAAEASGTGAGSGTDSTTGDSPPACRTDPSAVVVSSIKARNRLIRSALSGPTGRDETASMSSRTAADWTAADRAAPPSVTPSSGTSLLLSILNYPAHHRHYEAARTGRRWIILSLDHNRRSRRPAVSRRPATPGSARVESTQSGPPRFVGHGNTGATPSQVDSDTAGSLMRTEYGGHPHARPHPLAVGPMTFAHEPSDLRSLAAAAVPKPGNGCSRSLPAARTSAVA